MKKKPQIRDDTSGDKAAPASSNMLFEYVNIANKPVNV